MHNINKIYYFKMLVIFLINKFFCNFNNTLQSNIRTNRLNISIIKKSKTWGRINYRYVLTFSMKVKVKSLSYVDSLQPHGL